MNAEAKPRNRYLTRDQEEQLIKRVPARLRDLVIFILDIGARREEALTLTWNNADLERKPRGVIYFADTKNGEIAEFLCRGGQQNAGKPEGPRR